MSDATSLDRGAGVVGKGEVDTLEKLAELDQEEIVRGYMAGFDKRNGMLLSMGESKSYYHGWLNAQVDRGRMKSSKAQQLLAHEIVHRRKHG